MTLGYFEALELLRWSVFAAILLLLWRRHVLVETRAGVVVFGAFWVVAATIEFWVLGNASYADLAVTAGTALPTQLHVLQSGSALFSHAAAGGSDLDALLAFTGQKVSLERMLLAALPIPAATFLHKMLVSGVAFFGAYRLAREMGASRATAAGLGAIAVFGHETMVGPTWSHGLGYAILPLAVWVVALGIDRPHYWLRVAAVGLLYTVSCLPTHSALPLFVAIVFAAALMDWRRVFRVIPGLVLLALAIIVNWYDSLYAKAVLASSTFRGANYSWATGDLTAFFDNMLLNPLVTGVAPLALLAIGLSMRYGRPVRAAAILFASIAVGAVLSEVPWRQIPGLALLAGLNLNSINFAVIPLIVMVLAAASARVPADKARRISMVLIAFAAGTFVWYKAAHLSTLLSEGGLSNLQAVEHLDRAAIDAEAPTRVVVVPYRLAPNMLWPKGIDTLDGYYNTVLASSVTFWEKGILAPGANSDLSSGFITIGQARWDLKCCDTYDLTQYVDLEFLRIANVGFVLSVVPLHGDGITQVGGPTDSIPIRRTEPLPSRMRGYLNEVFDPPGIRVYRVSQPLPRVFAASDVVVADADPALVRVHAMRREAVIAPVDAARIAHHTGAIRLDRVRKVEDGFEIDVQTNEGGIILVNAAWMPFWQAKADGNPVALVPANLIHMAVAVPPGTRRLVLAYGRKRLTD